MPTLAELLAVEAFSLRELVAVGRPVPLNWAHSSDLVDPTPFTEPGQLLLTTGSQFREDAAAHELGAYVRRLADARVAAVGFGTEVIRQGTPAGLVRACTVHDLPLVEVPYQTPFIAISRWVAAQHAAAARSRLDWSLSTQRAVATAAISAGGLSAATRRAAKLLQASVFIVDSDLNPVALHPRDAISAPSEPDRQRIDVTLASARALLRAGRRAERRLEVDDSFVLLRTLGQGGRLRGIIAVLQDGAFDEAAMSTITTLTALAELSLEHKQDVRLSVRALLRELLELLREGQVDVVRKAIRGLPAGLPDRRLVVVALRTRDLPIGLSDTLERQGSQAANRTFHVVADGNIIQLVDARRWPAVRKTLLDARARAGVSDLIRWEQLQAGILQATRSLDAAPPSELLPFSRLVGSSVLGLLASSTTTDIAHGRLAGLGHRADGDRLLAEAAVWLRNNAQWDPAARELGIHRHSLKAHMRLIGDDLGLDLDQFAARAELWAMLAALGRTQDA